MEIYANSLVPYWLIGLTMEVTFSYFIAYKFIGTSSSSLLCRCHDPFCSLPAVSSLSDIDVLPHRRSVFFTISWAGMLPSILIIKSATMFVCLRLGTENILIVPSFKQTSFVFGGRRWITCSFRLWGSRISSECCKLFSAERNHHVTLQNWVFLRTICKCISDQQSCAVYFTFKITIIFLPHYENLHYTVETPVWICRTDS